MPDQVRHDELELFTAPSNVRGIKMGFLLVHFAETRRLVIDTILFDQTTGQVVEIEDGLHIVSLGEPMDFEPREIEIDLEGTVELDPLEIVFTKKG